MSSSCEPRVTSWVCGRHRISSEFDKLGWNGRDFLSGCSEREQPMKYQPARCAVIWGRKHPPCCSHPTLAITPSSLRWPGSAVQSAGNQDMEGTGYSPARARVLDRPAPNNE